MDNILRIKNGHIVLVNSNILKKYIKKNENAKFEKEIEPFRIEKKSYPD